MDIYDYTDLPYSINDNEERIQWKRIDESSSKPNIDPDKKSDLRFEMNDLGSWILPSRSYFRVQGRIVKTDDSVWQNYDGRAMISDANCIVDRANLYLSDKPVETHNKHHFLDIFTDYLIRASNYYQNSVGGQLQEVYDETGNMDTYTETLIDVELTTFTVATPNTCTWAEGLTHINELRTIITDLFNKGILIFNATAVGALTTAGESYTEVKKLINALDSIDIKHYRYLNPYTLQINTTTKGLLDSSAGDNRDETWQALEGVRLMMKSIGRKNFSDNMNTADNYLTYAPVKRGQLGYINGNPTFDKRVKTQIIKVDFQIPASRIFNFFKVFDKVIKNTKIEITLELVSDTIACIADPTTLDYANNKAKFIFLNQGIQWYIPQIFPRQSIQDSLTQKLNSDSMKALIKYEDSDIQRQQFVNQNNSWGQWDVNLLSSLPTRIYVWAQYQKADTDQRYNSLKFTRAGIERMFMEINGNVIPAQHYLVKPDDDNWKEIYRALLESEGLTMSQYVGTYDRGMRITAEDWLYKYPIFYFDASKIPGDGAMRGRSQIKIEFRRDPEVARADDPLFTTTADFDFFLYAKVMYKKEAHLSIGAGLGSGNFTIS